MASLAAMPPPSSGLSVTGRPDWLAEMRVAALRDAGQRAAAGRPVQPGPFGYALW